jgi:parvulin-like peptidyl-prolyl isomerase
MVKQSNTPKIVTKKHVARLERERRQVTAVRTVAISMIVLVALLLGYGYLDINYLQLRKPAAEVNGDKISVTEWQERVQIQRINLANQLQQFQFFQQNFGMDTTQQQQEILYSLQLPEILGQQVLDQMIDDKIIRQEAEKRGITVASEEVELSIQEAYEFFPNGTSTPTITPTAFEYPTLTSKQLTQFPSTATATPFSTSTPAPTSIPDLSVTATATTTNTRPTPTFVPEAATATATPYTLDGFKDAYVKTVDEFKTYGISEEALRTIYENQILRGKLVDAITADTPRVQEQVWARHILVADEATAATVKRLLAQGDDFSEVAAEYSTDTGSKDNSGDLGWFGRGAMVAEFETAAFTQEIGVIGEPVQSSFGFHIIQVLDRQELPVPADEYEQIRQTTFADWLRETRDASDVTTNDLWKQHLPPMPEFLSQYAQ